MFSIVAPIGFFATVINYVLYFCTDAKRSKAARLWIIVTPILLVLSWFVAFGQFGYYGAGV